VVSASRFRQTRHESVWWLRLGVVELGCHGIASRGNLNFIKVGLRFFCPFGRRGLLVQLIHAALPANEPRFWIPQTSLSLEDIVGALYSLVVRRDPGVVARIANLLHDEEGRDRAPIGGCGGLFFTPIQVVLIVPDGNARWQKRRVRSRRQKPVRVGGRTCRGLVLPWDLIARFLGGSDSSLASGGFRRMALVTDCRLSVFFDWTGVQCNNRPAQGRIYSALLPVGVISLCCGFAWWLGLGVQEI